MTTEERLDKLERELALLKPGEPESEVRANRFVLEDENGKLRAMLNVTKEGAALVLFDEKGDLRATLGALKGGPGLDLFDENGEFRAGLNVRQEGPKLGLFDKNGRVIWSAP
jgi:hypothetical protein